MTKLVTDKPATSRRRQTRGAISASVQPMPHGASGDVAAAEVGGRVSGGPDSSLWPRVGVAVHQALVALAADREATTVSTVMDAAGRAARQLPPIRSGVRLGVQHVAPLIAVGVRMFPPLSWSFVGGEMPAGGGRTDLVWVSPDASVVVDEVKVGGWRNVAVDKAAAVQITRYLDWGASEHGGNFAGVRLLTLAAPRQSRWFPAAGGGPLRLEDTGWWFGFAAPWEQR